MMPILQIGPLAVQLPGLIIILGLWLGLSLGEKYTKKFKVDKNLLYNLVFLSIVSGIIGGRILYIIRFPEAFKASPASIISINPGLLDPVGAFLVAALVSVIFLQKKKIEILRTLDAMTPIFAVVAIALSLSRLASGDGYGSPTNAPWAIELWGTQRHPTQIYEALLGVLILWKLWPDKLILTNRRSGEYFIHFIIMTSMLRIFTEAFHGDSSITPFLGVREIQLASLAILFLSLLMLDRLISTKNKTAGPN